jgi:hypothetical protein
VSSTRKRTTSPEPDNTVYWSAEKRAKDRRKTGTPKAISASSAVSSVAFTTSRPSKLKPASSSPETEINWAKGSMEWEAAQKTKLNGGTEPAAAMAQPSSPTAMPSGRD